MDTFFVGIKGRNPVTTLLNEQSEFRNDGYPKGVPRPYRFPTKKTEV
jgi:hypothetical protein